MLIAGLDAETIPSQILPEGCKPVFDPNEVALGNTKDQFKIKIKIQDAKTKFDEKLNKKMATDAALCQVCTFVGYFYDTTEQKITDKKIAQYRSPEEDGIEEYSLVYDAWDFIKHAFNTRTPLVSFNGKNFDLFVLLYRAMAHSVPVDGDMYKLLTDKWKVTKHHYDLMQILGGAFPKKGRNLDFFLRLFGIGEKTIDMDGSKVFEKWLNGDHDIIKEYCEDDVLSTCKLFARIEPWVIVE